MAPKPSSLNRPPRFQKPPVSTSDPKAFKPSRPSTLGREVKSENGLAAAAANPKPIAREGKGVSTSPLKTTVVNEGIRSHVHTGSTEAVPPKIRPNVDSYAAALTEYHARRSSVGMESPASLQRPDSPDSAISSKSTQSRTGSLGNPTRPSGEQSRIYSDKFNSSRSDLRDTIKEQNLRPRFLEPASHRMRPGPDMAQSLSRTKMNRDFKKRDYDQAEARVRKLEAQVEEYQAKVDRSGSTSSKIKEAFRLKKSAADLTRSLGGFKSDLAKAKSERDEAFRAFKPVDEGYQSMRQEFAKMNEAPRQRSGAHAAPLQAPLPGKSKGKGLDLAEL